MVRKRHLLIADDETNVLLTLQLVFQETGYAITTANSEAEAVQLLRKRRFDAVLTDMCMEQDQSGLEIVNEAARIRSRPVIIVFTGFGTMENLRATLGTKVDHVALKPVDIDGLKHTLARLLALRNDRTAAAS